MGPHIACVKRSVLGRFEWSFKECYKTGWWKGAIGNRRPSFQFELFNKSFKSIGRNNSCCHHVKDIEEECCMKSAPGLYCHLIPLYTSGWDGLIAPCGFSVFQTNSHCQERKYSYQSSSRQALLLNPALRSWNWNGTTYLWIFVMADPIHMHGDVICLVKNEVLDIRTTHPGELLKVKWPAIITVTVLKKTSRQGPQKPLTVLS